MLAAHRVWKGGARCRMAHSLGLDQGHRLRVPRGCACGGNGQVRRWARGLGDGEVVLLSHSLLCYFMGLQDSFSRAAERWILFVFFRSFLCAVF